MALGSMIGEKRISLIGNSHGRGGIREESEIWIGILESFLSSRVFPCRIPTILASLYQARVTLLHFLRASSRLGTHTATTDLSPNADDIKYLNLSNTRILSCKYIYSSPPLQNQTIKAKTTTQNSHKNGVHNLDRGGFSLGFPKVSFPLPNIDERSSKNITDEYSPGFKQ